MRKTAVEATELHTLILQIAQGNEASFERLYEVMLTPLSGYIASKFKGQLQKKDIEDIMQYTFLQIWRKSSSYRGKHTNSSAKKWMYTIARNRAYKVTKALSLLPTSIESYSRNKDKENQETAYEYKFRSQDHTENEAVEMIMSNKVIEICRKLPKREQDVLIMRFSEKRNLREIGEKHNLSSPRIKQIIDQILEFILYTLR
jgi:RNA polymerase sigma factor (sigma-70 family)